MSFPESRPLMRSVRILIPWKRPFPTLYLKMLIAWLRFTFLPETNGKQLTPIRKSLKFLNF